MNRKNRGMVFTLEAILAMSFLISTFLFLMVLSLENVSPYKRFERLNIYAKDALEVMSKLKVGGLIDEVPILQEQYQNGKITDNESSIIEVIGTFWALGEKEIAKEITREVLQKIMPKNVNYMLTADNEEIYSSSTNFENSEISQSSKYISGFKVGKIVKGFTARASLRKIESKTLSSYNYFGGFVGQGNITFYIKDIPSDTKITKIYIEGVFGSDFDLYINDSFCASLHKLATDEFPVDSWDIVDEDCLNKVEKGIGKVTKFNINFTTTDVTKKYIGGGYLKVTFETSQFSSPLSNVLIINLPGISDIINLYDSFYVPGNLKGMEIGLSFNSNETLFMSIGNKIVYKGNVSTVITNETLFNLLDYTSLSKKTVPIRLGHFETITTEETGYISDVILTTSLVEGMGTCDVDAPIPLNITPDCNLGLSDVQNYRIDLAKYLDKIFVEIVLNYTGNRVGLQGYHSSAPSGDSFREKLTNITTSLFADINGYNSQEGKGTRCLCCAIHEARVLLTDPAFNNLFADPSRKKFIILMSDGDAGKTTKGECPGEGDFPYTGNNWQDAINQACIANKIYNITVHTIGFGAGANNTLLQEIAKCGGGEWRGATDSKGLKEIYEYFARKISERSVIYKYQPIVSTNINSTLNPNSYISLVYEPEISPYEFGEISIKLETNKFDSGNGCEGNFFIPNQVKIDEITRTSYSSELWTKELLIKNSVYDFYPVYNLTEYGEDYVILGDPYHITFSPSYVKLGETNVLKLVLGPNYTYNFDECSKSDKVIYTIRLKAYTEYSPILPKSDEYRVKVYYTKKYVCGLEPDGYKIIGNLEAPEISVEELDVENNAIHYALKNLLDKLNFVDCPGEAGSYEDPIDIEITPELDVECSKISNIPSLWGPMKFTLFVWT